MRILYIGEPQTYQLYKKGIVPSHWLYGACEMEKDGHDVIWEKERYNLWNDLKLCRKYHPDIVFIPNLNIRSHILLLILCTMKLYRKPIFAYLHHGVTNTSIFNIKSILIRGISHIFFLSKKTMKETISRGYIKSEQCSVPGWGPDMEFYSQINIEDNGYFVSTGKENRDFETLIKAFECTKAPLLIITAKSHGDYEYSNLYERCKDIPNITVKLIDNTGSVYPELLKAMAGAKAIVCPLLKEKLDYCVGLSTITDAEGLGKPLIITDNPYHDRERMRSFHIVKTIDDWTAAINIISSENSKPENIKAEYTIQVAYQNMKGIMFK